MVCFISCTAICLFKFQNWILSPSILIKGFMIFSWWFPIIYLTFFLKPIWSTISEYLIIRVPSFNSTIRVNIFARFLRIGVLIIMASNFLVRECIVIAHGISYCTIAQIMEETIWIVEGITGLIIMMDWLERLRLSKWGLLM